jgi:hypothetical protein
VSRQGRIDEVVARLARTPEAVTFAEIRRVCDHYFVFDRQDGSHRVYKTGLAEPALVNIQPRGKMAKAYQCRQVAAAIRAKARGGR